MNVTAFCASPRKASNSEILADRILQGASAAGASVRKIRLHGLSIAPCRACGGCQSSPEARCAIDDDMAPLLHQLRSADAIVLASPVYFFSVSAQMKTFLDRTYALGGGGRWDALAGKRVVVALTYGDEDADSSGVNNAIGMFEDACSFLGMELLDVVHGTCSEPGEIETSEAVLLQAEAAGNAAASR